MLALDVQNLSYHYQGGVQALKQVSFSVEEGSFFALLGPNGAGKSTLAHILANLLAAQEGEALVAGHSVKRAPIRVRKSLGLVFQEPSLDDRLTVWENLDFHARLYQVGRGKGAKIRGVLELVELEKWSHALVRSLSRGMKRRVEIARAMLHEPKILMLDEPTVGLDVSSRNKLWDYLKGLQSQGVTLFLTTHYIEEAEGAHQVVIINEGEKVAEGTPHELKNLIGGDSLRLKVIPEGLEALQAYLASKVEKVQLEGEMLHIRVGNAEKFLAEMMPQYGDKVTWVEVERPTLEQVFINLAGKRIADSHADGREQLLNFAKAGGEHTR
ncbi:MAG: ABC transporter ATP-binding protein [Deinococcales bacterium]